MANELKPLVSEHKSLAELSHEAIRERILSGNFGPGEWLRQEELSQQLGVSHTPVREALDLLVADGLAERVPNRGVRVSPIDDNEIAEVYCLRLLLEPIVVGLAALNISKGGIDHLGKIVDQAEKLTSLEHMPSRRKMNREFHIKISKNCGNATLKRLHEIVWNKFPDWMLYEGLYRDPNSLTPRLQREIEEHRALLDAIANRNVEQAKLVCTSHIIVMKTDLIEVFEISSQVLEEKQRQIGI